MTRQIKTLGWGLVALVLVIGVSWILAQALLANGGQIGQIDTALAALKPVLMLWRLGLIALMFFIWPYGCRWLAQHSHQPLMPSELAVLIRLRWKLLVILIAVELLLVQRLLF